MAILTTATVNWQTSPRIILIDESVTDLSVQTAVDTCRWLENLPDNIDDEYLIDAAGKEDLGGGAQVGITATLNNAYFYFAARSTPLLSGLTCDTNDTSGVTFSGGAQDYSSVYVGCTIFNNTTGAMATVIGIDDTADTLTMVPLTGGSPNNEWTIGDSCTVYENEQIVISGGNLTAVNAAGASIEPVLQSPNVQIVRTASSSATISQLETEQLIYRLESQRDRGHGYGTVIYYDPLNGNDGQDGTRAEKAVKTFLRAHNLCTDGNNDVIQMLDTDASTTTNIDERWSITKNNIRVRGAGWGMVLYPTDDVASPAINITGQDCSLENFQVRTTYTGTEVNQMDCINVTSSDNTTLRHMKIKRSTGVGVRATDSDVLLIENCILEHFRYNDARAVSIEGTSHEVDIKDCFIYDADYDVYYADTAYENSLENNVIHDADYGVYIEALCGDVYIKGSNTITACDIADVVDLAGEALIGEELSVTAVWDKYMGTHITPGTFGAELAKRSDIHALGRTHVEELMTGSQVLNGTETGTFALCATRDNNYWQGTEDIVTGLDMLLRFAVPAGNQAGTIRIFGRYDGDLAQDHYVNAYLYDTEAAAEELVYSNFLPSDGTSDRMYILKYDERHIDRTNNYVDLYLRHNESAVGAGTHSIFIDFAEATSTEIVSNATIGDAVWNDNLADHTLEGTYGHEVATRADIQASAATNYSTNTSTSLTFGTPTGSDANIDVRDNNYWQIDEDGTNGITVEMTFPVPAGDRAGVFELFGRYSGQPTSTHFQNLYAYNTEALAWELLKEGFLPGGNASDAKYSHEYFERHIDRTLNQVQFRIEHNTTTYNAGHSLYIDSALCSSVTVITAADIADAVWDEDLTTHTAADSTGEKLGDIPDEQTFTI